MILPYLLCTKACSFSQTHSPVNLRIESRLEMPPKNKRGRDQESEETAQTWTSTRWRSASASEVSRCSSLKKMGLRSLSSYRTQDDFLEIVGIDFKQFKANSRNCDSFPMGDLTFTFDVSNLPNIEYLDVDGQLTCMNVMTNILISVCELAKPTVVVCIQHEPEIPRAKGGT